MLECKQTSLYTYRMIWHFLHTVTTVFLKRAALTHCSQHAAAAHWGLCIKLTAISGDFTVGSWKIKTVRWCLQKLLVLIVCNCLNWGGGVAVKVWSYICAQRNNFCSIIAAIFSRNPSFLFPVNFEHYRWSSSGRTFLHIRCMNELIEGDEHKKRGEQRMDGWRENAITPPTPTPLLETHWKEKITPWKLMKSHKLMRGKLRRKGVSAFSLAFSSSTENGCGWDPYF